MCGYNPSTAGLELTSVAIGVVRGSIVKNGAVGAEAVLGGDLLHETLALARLVVANSEELLADLLRSVDGDARAVTAHDPVWVRLDRKILLENSMKWPS